MFRYYQITGKDSWKALSCGPGTESEAKKLGATKLTILSTSELVTNETNKEDIAHKGPLYFDIDVKEDLDLAIKSTRKLAGKLRELQVPDEALHVYASGCKGMHLIIPARVFSSGRQVKGLPNIYAEMALRLDVLGMDYQVYSGGMGNCWRMANVQRSDGAYRIPITIEELNNITSSDYAELVKQPRNWDHEEIPGLESAGLAALFEQAKKAAKGKPKQVSVVPDSALAKFKDEPPNCIADLLEYKVKEDVKFNAAAMQLAIFSARSGTQSADTYASRLAKNSHSTQYSSEWKRETHTLGLYKYANYKAGMKFSCAAIVNLLKNRPCEGCSQSKKFTEDKQSAEEDQLVEKASGYYIPGEYKDKRITNFTIDPIAIYVDISNTGHVDRREGTLVEYKQNGVSLGRGLFEESGWVSKAGLKAQIMGIGRGLSYTGNEDDVNKVMHMVYKTEKDIDTITKTYTVGILFHKSGDRDIRVYTEPGYSVNQLGVRDTHNLEGSAVAALDLHKETLPKKGDVELNSVISSLLKVNSPEIVAQILGWYCACHLKTHFMYAYKQFPMLNLWGNAGAGKSKTADLFGWLCGVDDIRAANSINLPGTTAWPLIEAGSNSTTVPATFEEYNKSKMKPAMYTLVGEILKAAWDGQNLPRGTINSSKANGKGRTGASVIKIPMLSPIVVISEQAPDMSALQQRMVQILMNSNTRVGCEDPFMHAFNRRDKLRPLAKSMVIRALNTDTSWVMDREKENAKYVPMALEDRPRHSCKVLLTGLDFFIDTLHDLELPIEHEVRKLKQVMIDDIDKVADELIQQKKRTEVDQVLQDIALMAGMSEGTSQSPTNWLISGRHYVRSGNKLVIDAPIVHSIYKRFKGSNKEQVVIESTGQFMQLLAHEPYFIDAGYPCPAMVKGRNMTLLDSKKMKEKGIMIEMFQES